MGAEPNKPRLDSAELEDLAEDQEDAPLLQTSGCHTVDLAKSIAAPAAEQPPVPISVQRDCDVVGRCDSKYKGYRTSLCDCCAEPGGARLCCYGYFCGPCLFGQNVENLGPVRWSSDQAEPSVIPCWAAGLTFGVLQYIPLLTHKATGLYMPWVLQMLYRRQIRRQYSIEGHSDSCPCGDGCPGCCCKCNGDDCADCCSSFWCLPCALCQDAREIAIRGKSIAPTVPAVDLISPSAQDMMKR